MIQTSMLRFSISIFTLLGFIPLGLALLLSACGGGRGNAGGDNDGTDGRQMCASISEEWQASIASLENRCTTVQDCMVVGEPGGCDCGSTVTGDCGAAVARASYMGSEAERLARRFEAENCNFPSICSCGPTLLGCSPEGQCVFTHQFCLESDAGPAGAAAE
jgi:methenyltetrahydromethanopterin cyclohydrolase